MIIAFIFMFGIWILSAVIYIAAIKDMIFSLDKRIKATGVIFTVSLTPVIILLTTLLIAPIHKCQNCDSYRYMQDYCPKCGQRLEEDIADMECPYCHTLNWYTYDYCCGCGKELHHE